MHKVSILAAGVDALIRVDEIWLAVDPLDMHAGFDTALARVVKAGFCGAGRVRIDARVTGCDWLPAGGKSRCFRRNHWTINKPEYRRSGSIG